MTECPTHGNSLMDLMLQIPPMGHRIATVTVTRILKNTSTHWFLPYRKNVNILGDKGVDSTTYSSAVVADIDGVHQYVQLKGSISHSKIFKTTTEAQFR
jgi:hypothetical protein